MNLRVSLLLVVVLALVTGVFAIPWADFYAPRTVGQSNPAHEPFAQALPHPDHQQVAQARPPRPELAPAVINPDETRTPGAAATSAPGSKPAIAAEQPETDTPTVAQEPDATATQPAPVVAGPPAQTATPSPEKVATGQPPPAVTAAPSESGTPANAKKEPAPVVTAPIPATDKPATAAPADRKPARAVTAPPPASDKPAVATSPAEQPTPVVTTPTDTRQEPAPVVAAPPPATDKPAMATPADKRPTPVVSMPPPTDTKPEAAPVVTAPPPATGKPAVATSPGEQPTPVVTAPPGKPGTEAAPVIAAPTPPEKPAIVMAPLPEKRPDTSEAALAKNRPAKYLFGAKKLPSHGRARAIGYYPKGCLAGGVELPVDGPNWQAMRLSRNRNWGHPELVRFVERFAESAARETGWPGVLIGDLSQPRGGPTPFGHRSHQTGLDVDIWFMPMPEKRLSRQQREKMPFTNVVKPNGKELDPQTWTPETAKFIRAAAERPEVERVLVNAVIKKELCRLQGKKNWSWMAKVRPWYGHDDHIHVRLKCPADSPHCRSQPAVPGGDGCSDRELAHWFSDRVLNPKPPKHPKPRKEMMLAELPPACKTVLNAPAKKSHLASDKR